MPRLALTVTLALERKAAVLAMVSLPTVADPGVAPKDVSVPIVMVPALMVVVPL